MPEYMPPVNKKVFRDRNLSVTIRMSNISNKDSLIQNLSYRKRNTSLNLINDSSMDHHGDDLLSETSSEKSFN